MFCWTVCGLFEFPRIRTGVIREGFLQEEVELGATYQYSDGKSMSALTRERYSRFLTLEKSFLCVSVTSSVKW